MQLNDEYRLAAYVIAVSVVLLAISGVIAAADTGATEAIETPSPSAAETNQTEQNRTVTETDRIDLSVSGSNGTVAVSQGERTCRGGLRVEDPERTRTEIRLDDVTITLLESHDEPFDEIDRERFAELVWADVSGHAGITEYDHVEIRANQYYETVDRETPSDTVGVRVRPADGCLPTVEGEFSIENQSVDVHAAHPEIEGLTVDITDTIGVLGDGDRALVAELLESNTYASYTIQTEFDDPERVDATVLEATSDGEVKLKLTPPTESDRAVIATVDLESEAVRNTWTKVSFEPGEGSGTVVVNETDGDETGTFEVANTEGDSDT